MQALSKDLSLSKPSVVLLTDRSVPYFPCQHHPFILFRVLEYPGVDTVVPCHSYCPIEGSHLIIKQVDISTWKLNINFNHFPTSFQHFHIVVHTNNQTKTKPMR